MVAVGWRTVKLNCKWKWKHANWKTVLDMITIWSPALLIVIFLVTFSLGIWIVTDGQERAWCWLWMNQGTLSMRKASDGKYISFKFSVDCKCNSWFKLLAIHETRGSTIRCERDVREPLHGHKVKLSLPRSARWMVCLVWFTSGELTMMKPRNPTTPLRASCTGIIISIHIIAGATATGRYD